MEITHEQYQNALKIVRQYETQMEELFELEDDDLSSDYWEEDQEEAEWERLQETAASCTCGAWQTTETGTVVHIADCYCGAE